MIDDGESGCLVVIGASAGGVDALARFAAVLPQDFPAPVVVAQHADPKGAGRLAEILRRRTALQIETVTEQDDEMKGGHLYLASPGHNLTIKDHRVYSSGRSAGHPVPSIDLLFKTASDSFGDRVIAVILTGMGTDGVAGVRAVKERGGTVIVQELDNAAYPALPAAIPPHYIDFKSTIDGLSSLLTMLASPEDSQPGADGQALDAFLAQVRARSGIDFRQYKMPTIRRHLMRLMAAASTTNLSDYLRHLNTHPDAYQRLVSSFLIKVTGFFRDRALFEYLQGTVLPELIKEARDTHSELRLWSAGCATGEEAYSLAILLAELLGDDAEKLPARIFATDLDANAIDFARRGIYPAAAFEDMSPELAAKYFTGNDSTFQVKKKIRNMTVFGEYDLGQRAPFPRIDLVLCRNVLIYFTKELQQRTLQLFAFSLRLGGYLALGKAETTSPLPQYFKPVHPPVKVYRREGERLMIPAPVMVDNLRMPERPPSLRRPALRTTPQRRSEEVGPAPRWSLVDRLGAFLFDSDIGFAIVDRHYDILSINQAARNLFAITSQGIGEDLIHLAQVPASELKAALDAAFRGEMPNGGIQTTTRDPGEDSDRYLTILCYPDKAASKEGRTEGVIVVAIDSTRAAQRLHLLEKERDENRSTIARLTEHNERLAERQRALVQANSELSVANVDLRNANEHLMISAEEAEASAEEVETLNEEMQATSEELETLNEELHATKEELNTTNEELAARSGDLENAVKEREQQLSTVIETLATLRGVVEQLPLVACILNRQSVVSLASEHYTKAASANPEALPQIGDTWRIRSQTVELSENGSSERYRIVLMPLPKDSGETMVLLSLIHNK